MHDVGRAEGNLVGHARREPDGRAVGASRRELIPREHDEQRDRRAARERGRVEDGRKGGPLGIRVGPDVAGRPIRDGDRDVEVRQAGGEEPVVAVAAAAVQRLDDELDIARLEEPEVAGLLGQADGVPAAGGAIGRLSTSPRPESAHRSDRAPTRKCSRRGRPPAGRRLASPARARQGRAGKGRRGGLSWHHFKEKRWSGSCRTAPRRDPRRSNWRGPMRRPAGSRSRTSGFRRDRGPSAREARRRDRP